MAFQAATTSHTNDHTNTVIGSSRTVQNSHHSALNTSLKIAGVVLFITLCALIVTNARASGKEANDEFNTANQSTLLHVAAKVQRADQATTGDVKAPSSNNNEGARMNTSPNSGGTSVNVNVNGENVNVPANTSYSKVTTTLGGTTSVQISNTNGGTNTSSTFTNLNVSSNSFSNVSESSDSGGTN